MSSIANQTYRGTINEQREIRELIHSRLHRNIQLLNLKYPMPNDLSQCFHEGMLKNPNSLAFNQLAFYLMQVIDEKYITKNMAYLLHEPKLAAQFRREFLKFVNDISKQYKGYVSPIMSSWLVTAGGYKVAKLMCELSQVALKVFVDKIRNNQNAKEVIPEVSDEKIVELRDKLIDKIGLWYKSSTDMDVIYQMYLTQIENTQNDKDSKMKVLANFVDKMKKCSNQDLFKELDDILDIMKPSDLILRWSKDIDDRLNNMESDWNRLSSGIIELVSSTKKTSEEVVQRYTKKSIKSTVLEYDPEKHVFDSKRCIESEELTSMIKEMTANNVLNLPKLFRCYNIVLLHNFAELSLFKIDTKYCDAIKEKEKAMDLKQIELKQLESEIEEFYAQLKNTKSVDYTNDHITEENKWIYEALNIPSMNSLI